ncbi:MAG: glycosyltransferase family 2 protein [Lautropia sp.]
MLERARIEPPHARVGWHRIREWRGRRAPRPHAAIVVPARNEALRVADCLKALAAQRGFDRDRMLVVVVANGCEDATFEIAVRTSVSLDLPCRVLEVSFGANHGVGLARRIGVDAARRALPRDGIVATTDADGRVAPDWLAATARHLQVADAVCGRVEPDARECATLPEPVRAQALLEATWRRLARRLEDLIDPVPGAAPARAHAHAGGASLAFRLPAYLEIGGFRAMRCDEDRDIVTRLKRAGLRVAHADDVLVHASCRLAGRAPGGMADTLARRADGIDDVAGEPIEACRALLRRLRARAACRREDLHGFARRWPAIEAADPALRRTPVRLSELPAQIDALRRCCESIPAARPARRAAAGAR